MNNISCRFCKKKFESILMSNEHICTANKPKQVIRFKQGKTTPEDKAIKRHKKDIYDRMINGRM